MLLGQWQDAQMNRPLDTSADAHRVQTEAYRRMEGSQRGAIVFRLNDLARQAAVAGIRARHPEYDGERLRLAYARLVLGDELTRAVWPRHELVDP